MDAAVAAIDDLKSSIASLEKENEVLQRPIEKLIESSKANAKDVKRVDKVIFVFVSIKFFKVILFTLALTKQRFHRILCASA